MNNKNKAAGILEPRVQQYFLCLLVFAGLTMTFQVFLGAAELVLVLLLWLLYYHQRNNRQQEIAKYIQNVSLNVDAATKDTMLNAPLPMVIYQPGNDEIVWSNEPFRQITGDREHIFNTRMADVVPEFSSQWLLEGKSESPEEITVNERRYQAFGHISRAGAAEEGLLLGTIFWVDVTDLAVKRDLFDETRPVVTIITLDNYDELFKGVTDNAKSALLASIDEKIEAWTRPADGLLCKFDRDRYVFVFQEGAMSDLLKGKFSVLDAVRQLTSPNGIAATLSIGVGRDVPSFQELYQYASQATEMALSRGGDQAVIKNRFNFEFFGGRSKETEKRTKVKSRVMSSALGELISGASHVLVMGHKYPDLDAIGAAAGVVAIARKKEVPAYIIRDPNLNPATPMVNQLSQLPEYKNVFISAQDAMVMANSDTLMVVVDTNRPEQVQSQELLLSCNKVAVIDHHRRAATYIANAVLNFHEPYASSACELVSELLSYLLESRDLLRCEAEALLAGIVLDTKNFTMRTGGRTFEAAAYLRRAGADTAVVKKLFQNDLGNTVARYSIIQEAQMYHESIAIAAVTGQVNRVVAAQAADELLNVAGIEASFVLFAQDGGTIISGRSLGSVNVQVILEALGGGGNATIAGAQLADTPLDETRQELLDAIDKYFEDA